MRRLIAGSMAAVLVSGLGLAFTGTAQAVPVTALPAAVASTVASQRTPRRRATICPTPPRTNGANFASRPSPASSTANCTPEVINGSTVVKVGPSQMPPPREWPIGGAGTTKDKYVELAREKTDRIFVILAEFGDERDPNYPDQDTDPDTPGPTVFRRPAAQRHPAAQIAAWTTRRSGSGLQPGLLPGPVLRHRTGCRVGEDLLRAAVLRTVFGRRHGHRTGSR